MSGLAQAQREFMGALFGDAPAAAPGLAVYRRGALANLCGAVRATYPVVRRLVGDAFFDEAARRHALEVPSGSGNLDDYGAGFADFLAAYPHAAGLPYLPDVARLEWAAHEARRAAEARSLDLPALADAGPEQAGRLRMSLHPSVSIVRSPFPVLAIWEANQAGRDGTPGRDGGERVLVCRRDGEVALEAIDEPTEALARSLARGATLDEACEALGADAGRFPAALARLAAAGVLCPAEPRA